MDKAQRHCKELVVWIQFQQALQVILLNKEQLFNTGMLWNQHIQVFHLLELCIYINSCKRCKDNSFIKEYIMWIMSIANYHASIDEVPDKDLILCATRGFDNRYLAFISSFFVIRIPKLWWIPEFAAITWIYVGSPILVFLSELAFNWYCWLLLSEACSTKRSMMKVIELLEFL